MFIREDEDGTLHYTFTQPGTGAEPAGQRWAAIPRALLYDGTEAWDWTASAIIDVLPSLRDQRVALVKAARDAAAMFCTTAAGRVQCDADSRVNMSGSVQLATFAKAAGSPFSIGWIMADNSVQTLDADAMIAMGIAVGEHIAGCYAVAVAKQGAIAAATTRTAVEAVDPAAGWPP